MSLALVLAFFSVETINKRFFLYGCAVIDHELASIDLAEKIAIKPSCLNKGTQLTPKLSDRIGTVIVKRRPDVAARGKNVGRRMSKVLDFAIERIFTAPQRDGLNKAGLRKNRLQ